MLKTMADDVLAAEKKAREIIEEAKREYRTLVSRAREEASAGIERRRLEEESRTAAQLQQEAVRWQALKKQVLEETGKEVEGLREKAREQKDQVTAVMLKILLEGREV